ncbi:hypothetical protein AVEN_23022-1 [Araneus ventricosus]|uniref:Uncharacterized protein n=1 Tax=Araneus ventricosus TaxID=182803 RepID=A0A4Y2LKS9_ARAVE|nr:hypothetical protein AVEN_23022-1 [Araneus ventricosus]
MVRIPAELIHRGPTVHHPFKGWPRTANTWGFWLSMRSKKQSERRQLLMESSLACRRGMEGISKKAEGIEEGKLEGSKDPWKPLDRDTRTHLKKVSP